MLLDLAKTTPTVLQCRRRGRQRRARAQSQECHSGAARLVYPTVYTAQSSSQLHAACATVKPMHCPAPPATSSLSAVARHNSTCTASPSQRCDVYGPPLHTTVLALVRREAHTRYVTAARWGGSDPICRWQNPREGCGCGAALGSVRASCEVMRAMEAEPVNAVRGAIVETIDETLRSTISPQRWGVGGAVGRMEAWQFLCTRTRWYMGWAVAAAPPHETLEKTLGRH